MLFIFYTKPKNTRQQMLLQNQGRLKLGNFRHLHRHRLNVPPQESLKLDKEIQCVSSCLKKPNCFSLNTKKTTDDKFLCEFLNTSKYKDHDNLTKDDNYVHWYIEVSFPFLGFSRSVGRLHEVSKLSITVKMPMKRKLSLSSLKENLK